MYSRQGFKGKTLSWRSNLGERQCQHTWGLPWCQSRCRAGLEPSGFNLCLFMQLMGNLGKQPECCSRNTPQSGTQPEQPDVGQVPPVQLLDIKPLLGHTAESFPSEAASWIMFPGHAQDDLGSVLGPSVRLLFFRLMSMTTISAAIISTCTTLLNCGY